MTFAYPYLLALPPLTILLYLLRSRDCQAISYPSIYGISQIKPTLRLLLRVPVLWSLSIASLILLSIAAARPQNITVLNEPALSRNIMLTIDVSPSMSSADVGESNANLRRIDAVKAVVREFVAARSGDRIGLVVFGGKAYLQSPLTLDHGLLGEFIDRLKDGMAGDGTAIGDGLGVSLKRLEPLAGSSKAIILLTDGSNNAGEVNPLQAAKVASELGIKIHTIGIGSSKPVVQTFPGFFGQQYRQQVEYDEPMLKEIAKLTGGVFYNAGTLSKLKEVYEEIDKLERQEGKEPEKKIAEELFFKFAAWGSACYLLFVFLTRTYFLKVP